MYTADHGLSVGQHGLMGKQNVYDHSIRIPFILRGPGVPQGRRIPALASNIDMFPTLAELCGLRMPAGAGGVSLVPLLEGRERLRPVVCTAYRDVQRMAKDGKWKLIRYYRSPVTDTGTDRIQLFDLEADPWETNDVSGDPANAPHIRRLAEELQRWMEEYGDFMQERPVLPN
ncbi:Choline-sulfatase [Paenibacillus sp. P1XP2]|nr:Choline-sulfatase [Paenibacillus sp. P1XP2]